MGKTVKYTREFFKIIQRDYDSGLSWREISKKYNISENVFYKNIKKGNLKSRTREENIKMYKDNGTFYKRKTNIWTIEKRKEHSKILTNYYKVHPEKHPNFKLRGRADKLSYPERIAYRFLEQLEIKFTIQEPVSGFWLDFFIIDDKGNKIDLEIDSEYWHKYRTEQDTKRDRILTELGYFVIRIPAKTVYENLKEIFKDYNKDIKLDLKKIKQDTIIIPKSIGINNKNLCDCGSEKLIESKQCKKCFVQYLKVSNNLFGNKNKELKFNISKEELTELIKEHSMEYIGKMFGVSGNSINKRCKKLDIEIPKRIGEWTEKLITDRAYELYEVGKSFQEISHILNITKVSVRERLKRNYGIKSNKNNKLDENKILKLLKEGRNTKYIMKELNCSSHVYRIIKKIKNKIGRL